MIHDVQAIVLAAGKATRFKTEKTKLIEKICGQEIILHITKLLEHLNIETTLVVGFQKELIMDSIRKHHHDTIPFAIQDAPLGTGHALSCSRSFWHKDLILILNGDTPLLTPTIIEQLYAEHRKTKAVLSFVTAHHDEPSSSYGRVIKSNKAIRIVEANEFAGDPQINCWINAGIYLVNRTFLEQHSNAMVENKISKEFYITDLIAIASSTRQKVATISAPFDQVRGINTLHELWITQQILRSAIIRTWMDHGVYFNAAQSVHIDIGVTIGAGSSIGMGVHILGTSAIGKNCTVGPFSTVENSVIEDDCIIEQASILKETIMHTKSHVGPFAHMQHSSIGSHTIIGNFVETKRTIVGAHSNAKHLSYLGDATIGNRVNIGAGTITCNFDGVNKHKTVIADHTQIGSNSSLVAPIHIGSRAYTGAGSVITKDIPDDTLAIARAQQTNKVGYVPTLMKKRMGKSTTEQTA